MVFDVELTLIEADRYRARVLLLPEITAEAASRDEALDKIRSAIVARHNAGAEIVRVAIDELTGEITGNWRKHAGAFPDDDLYQQMLAVVEQQRCELDAEMSS